jgi:hypothetical protein
MRKNRGLALVLLLVGLDSRGDDVRGLLSACADGNLAICQQLENSAGRETGSKTLDRLAGQFAGRAAGLALEHDGEPRLDAAYPLIVTDYFAAPQVNNADRARWLRPELLSDCAQHYSDTWIHERNWWPMDARAAPDWHLIYLHVLDHYFGYCVH